jgi:hypothetical protein
MQCDEFDARLHKLLDRRRAPDADLHLRRHARTCPRCERQLCATARLLTGLELLEVPPLSADFAARVVQEVAPASSTPRAPRVPLAIAVAATLLIVLLPGVGYLLRSSQSWSTNSRTPASSTGKVAYATPSTPADATSAVTDSPWMHFGNSILQLYPEKTRARHRQQVSALAKDLRPIATPFNTAVTALRRTIPVKGSNDKGQPSASAAPRTASLLTHV